MTELELMDTLQQEGWTFSRVESGNQQIFRAGRFRNGAGQTRYIATINTLPRRSKEDVLRALTKQTMPIQRHKGAGRKAAASTGEASRSAAQRHQTGQGMQDIDFTLPFEERSKIYIRMLWSS